MAITEYQSAKTIIAKVFRDFRIQDSDWINDGIEWIGEAMDAIGSFAQTESKSKILKTYSHSARIPNGTITINSIYYGLNNSDEDIAGLTREDFDYVLPYGNPEGHPAFVEEDEDHPTDVDKSECDENWILTGKYIKTSFESDYILVNYQRIALDEDGFPIVPKSYEFNQALYWYIVHKLMEGGQKHPAGLNYLQARDLWLTYCSQARNQANMPTPEQAERLREIWVSLLPVEAYGIEDQKSKGIDAKNLKVDTFQRYTVEE